LNLAAGFVSATKIRQSEPYRRFERLYEQGHLFVWLTPQNHTTTGLKTTTNSLEGGVDAQLKHLARAHRGTFDEHQRIIMDWWLYLHTQHHDDPLALAIEQNFGHVGYAHARQAHMRQRDQANSPDGRPKGLRHRHRHRLQPLLGHPTRLGRTNINPQHNTPRPTHPTPKKHTFGA